MPLQHVTSLPSSHPIIKLWWWLHRSSLMIMNGVMICCLAAIGGLCVSNQQMQQNIEEWMKPLHCTLAFNVKVIQKILRSLRTERASKTITDWSAFPFLSISGNYLNRTSTQLVIEFEFFWGLHCFRCPVTGCSNRISLCTKDVKHDDQLSFYIQQKLNQADSKWAKLSLTVVFSVIQSIQEFI